MLFYVIPYTIRNPMLARKPSTAVMSRTGCSPSSSDNVAGSKNLFRMLSVYRRLKRAPPSVGPHTSHTPGSFRLSGRSCGWHKCALISTYSASPPHFYFSDMTTPMLQPLASGSEIYGSRSRISLAIVYINV